MTSTISREDALELLRKYNKEPFHIQHGLTVEKVLRWFQRYHPYRRGESGMGIKRSL